MREYEVFRPKSNFAWAGLSFFLLLIFVLQSVFYPARVENLAISALVAIFLSLATYIIWVRPKLEFYGEFLRVINPFTTVTIRYSDIERMETEWSLQITHNSRKTRVWVAPANGRRSARGRLGMRISGTIDHTESTISHSEVVAQLINARLKAH